MCVCGGGGGQKPLDLSVLRHWVEIRGDTGFHADIAVICSLVRGCGWKLGWPGIHCSGSHGSDHLLVLERDGEGLLFTSPFTDKAGFVCFSLRPWWFQVMVSAEPELGCLGDNMITQQTHHIFIPQS